MCQTDCKCPPHPPTPVVGAEGEEGPSKPADAESSKDQDQEGGVGAPQDGSGVRGAQERRCVSGARCTGFLSGGEGGGVDELLLVVRILETPQNYKEPNWPPPQITGEL